MRRIIAMILCLMLTVSLAVSASAASALKFLVQNYDVSEDQVICYGKQLPPGGKLEVSVSSRILENASVSTLETERTPVTLYCLVDSATSLSDKALKRRTDTLLTFSSLMGPEDSMVIATIDEKLTESKPLDKKDARDTAIKTISGQVWYTNLHDGISQALKTLQSSTAYNTNRCLVIVSDGHDDGKSIAKTDAILKQIQETGIAVHSVIITDASVTSQEVTLHKQMTGESMGGSLTMLDQDGISASAAAQEIWSSVKGGSVISIDAAQLQGAETDQQLLIRYDTANTRFEDTILIRAVDLPVPETEPMETEITPTTEETTEPTEGKGSEEEEGPTTKELILYGTGAVLALLGVAAFFLLRKKPVNTDPNTIPDPTPDDQPVEPNIFDTLPEYPPEHTIPLSQDEPKSSGTGNMVTQPVENRCHVSAVAIMHPEVTADFYLVPNMEATFGRNSKADILLNPNDTKLSGCHGCFLWDGKMLLVQDRKSTNGTGVNGETCPEKVWLRVQNGDILNAGLYDYRITFHKD